MGEKGIASDALASVAPVLATTVAERSTTIIASTSVKAATDVATAVRDKTIGAVADHIVSEGHQRLVREPSPGDTAEPGVEPAEDPGPA
ncbi:MAG: hypothetical protein ABW328_11440 [Ilumatobacteraceae bacterium]